MIPFEVGHPIIAVRPNELMIIRGSGFILGEVLKMRLFARMFHRV